MALSLPYPGQPATNSALSSLPVQANITAIAQAIQSFDGSQITAGSVSPSALAANINPNTLLHDTISSFVQSGCVWSSVSGLVGTMTGGTIYVGPSTATYRVTVNGVGSHTFTASQDTYIDIDYNANIVYQGVSNNATAPSITANSIRVAKVVTNGTTITSVVQSGRDSLGYAIYPNASINSSDLSLTITNNISYNNGGTTSYTLTNAYASVTGLTTPSCNLSVAGAVLVMGTVNIQQASATSADVFFQVIMDASTQANYPTLNGEAQITFSSATSNLRQSASYFAIFTGVAAGSHTFMARAYCTSGTLRVDNTHTALSVIPLAS